MTPDNDNPYHRIKPTGIQMQIPVAPREFGSQFQRRVEAYFDKLWAAEIGWKL